MLMDAQAAFPSVFAVNVHTTEKIKRPLSLHSSIFYFAQQALMFIEEVFVANVFMHVVI